MLANVKTELSKERDAFRADRKGYVLAQLRLALPIALALFLFVLVPLAAAQDPVELELDPVEMTNGLFSGANIIIAALGAIMFMLAGFKLGGALLKGIVSSVSNVKI